MTRFIVRFVSIIFPLSSHVTIGSTLLALAFPQIRADRLDNSTSGFSVGDNHVPTFQLYECQIHGGVRAHVVFVERGPDRQSSDLRRCYLKFQLLGYSIAVSG